MRKFSETETLVIEELKSLGVTVYQDEDSEYYFLECSKDGFTAELSHADIDALYNLNDERVKAFCAKFENEMTAEKKKIIYPEGIESEF